LGNLGLNLFLFNSCIWRLTDVPLRYQAKRKRRSVNQQTPLMKHAAMTLLVKLKWYYETTYILTERQFWKREIVVHHLHPLPWLALGNHPMSHYTVLTTFINPARYMFELRISFLMSNLVMESLYNGLAYCAMYPL